MIVFDANILITLTASQETDETYERIAGLVQDLAATKTVIGVPALLGQNSFAGQISPPLELSIS